jgi:hypothetical protein
MPDFAGATPVESLEDIVMSFVWDDGSKRTRRITNPPTTVTLLEAEECVERLSALSNAGLYKYKSNGTVREIALGSVTIYDESHSITTDLILFYQKQDTLDTREIRIPAPNAAFFSSGVVLKDPIATGSGGDAQENAINDALVALDAVINKGLVAGQLWSYQGGYLSTATPQERRKVPNASLVLEPPAGSPTEPPGEDPTP